MIIFNKFLPQKGFYAMNLFGVIFVREEYRNVSPSTQDRMLNHEAIHSAQMRDFAPKFLPNGWRLALGGIIFYLVYVVEWIYRVIFHTPTAYDGLSFEREAYKHEGDFNYCNTRKRFGQWSI